jgi:hypothetical protein
MIRTIESSAGAETRRIILVEPVPELQRDAALTPAPQVSV